MFPKLTPITKNIIILNVILYIASKYLYPSLFLNLSGYFPLSPNFHSWQIVTHMFMHANFAHILFNMMTLWSFGPILEQTFGDRKFLLLYFAAGLGGFFLFNLVEYIQVLQCTDILNKAGFDIQEIYKYADNNYSGETSISANSQVIIEQAKKLFVLLKSPMLGASGAIFGVVAAFSTLFPEAKLFIMFIPFPIKAKYILPVVIVISLFLGVGQFSFASNIAHFAHIGGALVGFLIAFFWKRNQFRRR